MAVELWTGLMCFGSASRGELRRFWLGLFRCATGSHGVAVLVRSGAVGYVPVGHGVAGYGGRGTVRSGSVRRGEVGSVKAGRGGYGVERLL